MKEYKVICIDSCDYDHRVMIVGSFDPETNIPSSRPLTLKETIEKLTIEINRYINNGAILNGGVSIIIDGEGNRYIVSQAITITRYPPPDGDEEC